MYSLFLINQKKIKINYDDVKARQKENKMITNNNKQRTIAEDTTAQMFKKAVKENFLTSFMKESMIESFIISTCRNDTNVGQVSNKCTTNIALSLMPALAQLALLRTFGIAVDESNKGQKYTGIVSKSSLDMDNVEKYCTDNQKVLVTKINKGLAEKVWKEMQTCDLSDYANIKKIYWDLNVIYRMYQELTIDAAKKANQVEIEALIEGFRPMSLQKFSHKFNWREKVCEIVPNTQHAKNVELFEDHIYSIQKDLVNLTTDLANKSFEIEVAMSEEEKTRLLGYRGHGPIADLVQSVKHSYSALTGQHQEALEEIRNNEDVFGEDEEAIASENKRYQAAMNVLRVLALQLLDGVDDNNAASILQLVACTDSNGSFDKHSGNQIAVSLMPEKYLAMVLANGAKVNVMGYRLAVDNKLEIDSDVEFVNGVSNNGSILEFKNEIEYATGTFRIKKFNGIKYAVKNLEFISPNVDYSKRVFSVKQKSYKEIETIKELMAEGNSVVIDELGDIKSRDIRIAAVKCEFGDVCDMGNTISDLLNIRGTVSYLNIIESKDYGYTVIFELSDVVELEDKEFIMPEVEQEPEISIEVLTTSSSDFDDIEEFLDAQDDQELEDLFAEFN